MWFIALIDKLDSASLTGLIGLGMAVLFFAILKGVVITKGDTTIKIGGSKGDKNAD